MNEASRILLAAVVALSFLGAISQQRPEQPASDTEIRIGNLMPYTGALAAYAAIGNCQGYISCTVCHHRATPVHTSTLTTFPHRLFTELILRNQSHVPKYSHGFLILQLPICS